MPLQFTKGTKILNVKELKDQEPITLTTYEEISQSDKSEILLFMRLITESQTTTFYYYKDIIKLRYSIYSDTLMRYNLFDPINRQQVKFIEFYASKQPLHENSEIKFECNEEDIFRNPKVLSLVSKDLEVNETEDDNEMHKVISIIIFFMVLLCILIFLDVLLYS